MSFSTASSSTSNDDGTETTTTAYFKTGTLASFKAYNTNRTDQVVLEREIDLILSILLSILSCYLLVATLTYYFTHSQSNLLWTNRICCCSALLLFFGTVWYQLEIHLTNPIAIFCRANSIVNVVRSLGNRTLIYIVLWIRMRYCYKNFERVGKVKLNVISYGLLIALISLSAIQMATLISTPNNSGERRCKPGTAAPFLKVFTPIVFVTATLFQIVLLGPVLYPIYRKIQTRRVTKKQTLFEGVFFRLSLCTTVCIITDLIFLAFAIPGASPKFSVTFIPICYSINMTINIACVLISFSDFRLRFFPFQKTKVDSKQALSTARHAKQSGLGFKQLKETKADISQISSTVASV